MGHVIQGLILVVLVFTAVPALGTDPAPESVLLDIPPGGYAWAPIFDGRTRVPATVYTMAPGPWMTGDPLPPDEMAAFAYGVGVTSEELSWLSGLRELRVRLNDLLHIPVNVGSDAVPSFADIDGDLDLDLVVRDGTGGIHAFCRPGWAEADRFEVPGNTSISADMDGDGIPDTASLLGGSVILLQCSASPVDTLSGFTFEHCSGVALGDMEGDGLADLVVGLQGGGVVVYRNRGSSTEPLFLHWSDESLRLFPMRPGTFSSPAPCIREDSVLVLPVGTGRNGLLVYTAQAGAGEEDPGGGWELTDRLLTEMRNVSPAVIDPASGEMLAAVRDGAVLRLTPGNGGWDVDTLATIPGTYPVISPCDIDGDGLTDLLSGTREGGVFLLRGAHGGTLTRPEPLAGFPEVACGAPVFYDGGILTGTREGDLRYYLEDMEGIWQESTDGSVFQGIFTGEYSVPAFCDLDLDGDPELVVGDATGGISCFRLVPDGRDEGPVFLEILSWDFQPNSAVSGLDRYYARYFPEYAELMFPADTVSVRACLSAILDAPSHMADEVAMAIAYTPTEVLRAMVTEGDIDLFMVNAECVYQVAEVLQYAELRDSTGPDGAPVTDLLLLTEEGWFPVDRDIYYRFVVNPRILFEVPARIDASYWLAGPDSAGVTLEEWLAHEPVVDTVDDGEWLFWREAIPMDDVHGSRLMDSAVQAETVEQAVLRLCNWQSHSQPDGLMEFGYLTNDLQPLVIYRKAYGSCGEQSILQTAMCRALLIPAYVVGCRGEDHQWNEFLDPSSGRWTHWDVNYGSPEISHIWVSGEGTDHTGKTISTITAFGPDDSVWETTGSTMGVPGSGYMPGDSGYTATASVDVTVTDASGRAVEGAMVLARSHWDRRNMVSTVAYTDLSGGCSLDLGYEPYGGYTLDVVTPFGTTGCSNFQPVEGARYSVRLTVPGSRPPGQIVSLSDTASPGLLTPILSDSLLLRPVSYYTGQLYTLDQPEPSAGYRGARWAPGHSVGCYAGAVYMDASSFAAYGRGEDCTALGEPFTAADGDTCYMVIDNRSSLFHWRRVELDLSGQVPLVQPVTIDGRTAARPETPSMFRSIVPPAAEFTDPLTPDEWTTALDGVVILQDDASDPLSAGWVLGPFTAGDERSLTFSTTGLTEGFDMDMFLFTDLNGNRSVDGMEEQLASSTSPTASEEIILHDPAPGAVYWLYLLGWSVPEDGGMLTLGLDFEPVELRLGSLTPSGPVTGLPGEFRFTLEPGIAPGERLVAAFGQWETVPVLSEGVWSFSKPPEASASTCPEVLLIGASGRVLEKALWSFVPDSLPPLIGMVGTTIDGSNMTLQVEVPVTDAGSGVLRTRIEYPGSEPVMLEEGADGIWTGTLDLLPEAGSQCSLFVYAEDLSGNAAIGDTLDIQVPQRPPVILGAVSPVGVTYDPRPLIQCYPDVVGETGWTVSIVIESASGEVSRPEPLLTGPCAVQFRPILPLGKGDHLVTLTIEMDDSESVWTDSWSFTVAEMGDV